MSAILLNFGSFALIGVCFHQKFCIMEAWEMEVFELSSILEMPFLISINCKHRLFYCKVEYIPPIPVWLIQLVWRDFTFF
jgi:hypothetical protein